MAVDTRDRRASCLGLSLPFRLVLPVADFAVDAGDRQQAAYTYRGIAASAPTLEAFATIDLAAVHTTSLELTARHLTSITLEALNG